MINLFILKEHIFDTKTNTGFLAWRIRNLRSRCPLVTTRTYKRKIEQTQCIEYTLPDFIENTLSFLKNKVINIDSDKQEVLVAMERTFDFRRKWIYDENPSTTLILQTFPKFIDMPFLVNFP